MVDLIGNGRHIRTVPIPDWVKATLDEWTRSHRGGAAVPMRESFGRDLGRRSSPQVVRVYQLLYAEVLAELTAGRKNGDRHKCPLPVLLDSQNSVSRESSETGVLKRFL